MRAGLARWLMFWSVVFAPLASACTSGTPPSQPATAVPSSGAASPAGSVGASQPATSPTPSALRFRVAATAAPAVAGHLLPYWVGTETGVFRQQGINLELAMLQSEPVALAAAANGEVDAVIATPGPLVLATLAGGVDYVILGATHNAFDQHIISPSDIEKADDLVGKALIIGDKGTLSEWQTREALERIGVEPDRDLAGWWTGVNQAERVENMRLGNGSGTLVPPPLSTILAREGFTDFGDLSEGPPWPGVAIFMARRVYATRSEPTLRFLRGLVASIHRTKTDPTLAKQLVANYTKIDDPEAVEATYAVYGDRLLERVPYVSREGLQRALDFAVSARPVVRRLQVSSLVDQSLLERLESSGYIAELYR
jgi:ABC-type nitrate/sulfonate/bicarbonate transport system substrate-binding protein